MSPRPRKAVISLAATLTFGAMMVAMTSETQARGGFGFRGGGVEFGGLRGVGFAGRGFAGPALAGRGWGWGGRNWGGRGWAGGGWGWRRPGWTGFASRWADRGGRSFVRVCLSLLRVRSLLLRLLRLWVLLCLSVLPVLTTTSSLLAKNAVTGRL